MNPEKRRLRRKKKKRKRLKPDMIKLLLEKTGLTLDEAIEKGYIAEVEI